MVFHSQHRVVPYVSLRSTFGNAAHTTRDEVAVAAAAEVARLTFGICHPDRCSRERRAVVSEKDALAFLVSPHYLLLRKHSRSHQCSGSERYGGAPMKDVASSSLIKVRINTSTSTSLLLSHFSFRGTCRLNDEETRYRSTLYWTTYYS